MRQYQNIHVFKILFESLILTLFSFQATANLAEKSLEPSIKLQTVLTAVKFDVSPALKNMPLYLLLVQPIEVGCW